MSNSFKILGDRKAGFPAPNMITFYHDVEQDFDNDADIGVCRRMINEFLAIEKQYGIPATYNVVGKIFREQPDLINTILEAGQEIAFHSFNHQKDWRPDYFANEVKLCRETSAIPVGYRSPCSQFNNDTLQTLWDNKFLWDAESDDRREPYFVYKGLVRLPIAMDDWEVFVQRISPVQWVEKFSELLKTRAYVSIGSHDVYTSYNPEVHLRAWEELIQLALKRKALIVSFSEAADLFRRAALSQYYSIIAKSWNCETKSLYRTRRFREIIQEEAKKLNRPVIVDLGSGGGVLTSQLSNIADKIYCVDNSLGMLNDIGNSAVCIPQLGEVTETNLPDNVADFVVCSRVIEYLFWPDRLADEIKRIGKRGSKYLVTFPACRKGDPPKNEGAPPDRVRRYFTAREVERWASQIGAGSLIGIQYKNDEPKSEEEEKLFRKMEQDPPDNVTPRNWVYIGTIQQEFKPKDYRKVIPLSVFQFQFRNENYYRFIKVIRKVGRLFPKPIRKVGKFLLGYEKG